MDHGHTWRSATNRPTAESVGESKPIPKQEIAKKLARAKLQ